MNGEVEPTVTFTVKQMFQEVDKKLEYIIAQLTTKASATDVAALEASVKTLEERVGELESEVKTFKRLAAAFGAIATVGLTYLQLSGGL